MLSSGAFNALLKTLEEPPEHVKFILATTEPQKLPATILSRCQKFDFKRISNENIIKRLEIVCKEAKIDITNEALKIIAVLSEGALRDALSILERCAQDEIGKIDENKVRDLVGIPKITSVHNIIKNVIKYNPEDALNELNQVLQSGKDLQNLLWEIIKYVKDILLYKTSNSLEIYNEEEISKIEEISKEVSKERLINIIYLLSEIENNIKWSSQKEIILQTGIIKISTTVDNDGIEEINKRLKSIEEKINNGVLNKEVISSNNQFKKDINTKSEASNNKAIKQNTPKTNIQNLTSEEYWKKVMDKLKASGKMILYSNLVSTKAKQKDDLTLEIIFPNGLTPFGKTILEAPENVKELSKLVGEECGKQMHIKFIDAKEYVEKKENNIEDMIKGLDVPINIVE